VVGRDYTLRIVLNIQNFQKEIYNREPLGRAGETLTDEECCVPGVERVNATGRRYSVEAVATIDERGQMVLPKAIRERLGLKAGEKLAISVMERDGRPCCINLIRTEELSTMVGDLLGPAVEGVP
jgi:AbrB family looped-hinge helix DNA binding protein